MNEPVTVAGPPPLLSERLGTVRFVGFAVSVTAGVGLGGASEIARHYSRGLPFNGGLFLVFLVWFFVTYHFLAVTRAQKLWLLSIGSLLFYGSWGAQFVPLVLGTGLADFWLARRIQSLESGPLRKGLLAASIGMNLAVLGVFKYLNFGVQNAYAVARLLGADRAAPVIQLAMPIGISFYTFQAISYTVDVYRGSFLPRKQLHEFIAGLTFFPHLAAGPIVRASYLLPQFEALPAPAWGDCVRGFLLISTGLLSKTVADLLALAVDPVFSAHGPHGAVRTWTGVIAFGGQVFGDFCGYTDIATGVALLLGFTLPPNFELPYLSRSPAEFWRRWHISLSTWLRDYLWFPLARKYPKWPYASLLVTMLLCGLWHGAAWTFAIWGLYHGVLLAVSQWLSARFRGFRPPRWLQVGQWTLTMYLVFVGFAVFRATTVDRMVRVLTDMHSFTEPEEWTYRAKATLVFVVLGVAFGHGLSYLGRDRSGRLRASFLVWPLMAVLLGLSFAFGRVGHSFIYFQF